MDVFEQIAEETKPRECFCGKTYSHSFPFNQCLDCFCGKPQEHFYSKFDKYGNDAL